MKRLDRHLLRPAACAALVISVLAACAAGLGPSGPLTIRGEMTYQARVALPSESVAIAELARAQDSAVVAEQRQPLAGRQVPVPFEVKPHPAVLERDADYFLRVAIALHGRTIWVGEPVEVPARLGIINVGTLTLKPYQADAFSAPLVCGERTARVDVGRIEQREILQLTVGGERFELHQTSTASGARYEAVNDPRTFVWFKGQRATLAVRGVVYPECVVADDGAAPRR
jgi:uncharacterized lipoprotein YbaY